MGAVLLKSVITWEEYVKVVHCSEWLEAEVTHFCSDPGLLSTPVPYSKWNWSQIISYLNEKTGHPTGYRLSYWEIPGLFILLRFTYRFSSKAWCYDDKMFPSCRISQQIMKEMSLFLFSERSLLCGLLRVAFERRALYFNVFTTLMVPSFNNLAVMSA